MLNQRILKSKLLVILTLATLTLLVAIMWLGFTASLPRSNQSAQSLSDGLELTSTTDSISSAQASDTYKVCIVGDMNLASDVGKYILDGLDPFQFMQERFKTCDLLVGNLETNISAPGIGSPQPGKSYTFNAPLQAIDKLVAAGFDIVSLANNHTVDYGRAALVDEMNRLTAAGIAYTGAGKTVSEAFAPRYVMVGETKIAFVAYNDAETGYSNVQTNAAGSAFLDQTLVKQAIRTAQENADVVVAFPHWGVEHQRQANSRQMAWAKTFIDAGADLVVGAHPHVRQNIEEYNGKKIYYSLGNFVFAGMGFNPEAIKGYFLTLTVSNGQIVDQQVETVDIVYHGFPKWPEQVY